MKIVDPITGKQHLEKRRKRFHEPGQPRELTFSCYRRYRFLERERTRDWFRVSLEKARRKFSMQIWAYVVMPEHLHLLVYPGHEPHELPRFLQHLKESVARKAMAYLRRNAPTWLERLKVREGKCIRHRFWQPGGGYDRNVISASALRAMIDYLHGNPVRRGLVAKAEDWEWSSARWYAGMHPVKIEMDNMVLTELARDGDLQTVMGRAEVGVIRT
jgi:putative transposase